MKWEYEFVSVTSESMRKHFRAMGNDGWELVSVNDDLAYFKRPIKSEDKNIYGFNPDGEGMIVIGKRDNAQKPLIDAIGKPLDTGG